jgi:hypothetical protein
MRVDNRVTQVPPVRNRQQDNEATSRSVDISRNRTRGELPANPNRTRALAGGPSHGGNSAGGAGGNRKIIPHRDPGGRCRCLNHSTSMGGTRSKVEGGDRHDLEPEGTREDTRLKIYTGSGSQSSYPTSCLE